MKFLKLKEYIQNGEYQKIDEWFEENKISGNLELENELIEKFLIGREKLFPSFSNKKRHAIERTKIEIAILKNLSFDNQLKFLFLRVNKIKSDHFGVLNLTPENEKILKSNLCFIYFITKNFTNKNFKEIDEIQEKLSFNVMDQKINTAIFCYDIDSYVYIDDLPISKPIFSPKCDIIFNYSEEKRKFLEEKNIALPTIEEANILCQEMKKTLEKHGDLNPIVNNEYFKEKINQASKNYEAIQLNMILENELQIKDNTKRKIKI